ncbi:MAG: two-component sensor histidine kinase [Burkholderiales bacterium]|nr:two-component sensor histidine kinase [Burkholderiales bacterium]
MADSTQDPPAGLQAELAAVRAETQEFMATVSHDLRAPLRHIVSYAQLVQEDAGPQLDAEVQGFLTTIVDSAKHMGALLDGLSELSRVGTLPLELEPVSLQALVQDVCDTLSAALSGAVVEWHIDDDLPTVQADRHLLRQALVHVLGNAVKFSAGREQPVVAISRVADGVLDCETLQVRDNGVGFNPALQGKLFKVFGRLHSQQQFPGIGMGLVLTRKLLQRMDATVAVQGAVDAGCSVRLCFRAGR